MSGIHNKGIVITGASSGMGEAAARLLAARGARLVLGARGEERLAALVQAITADGGDAVHAATDVTRQADVARLVALARARYGRLGVLIGNAGIGPISPLDDWHAADWERMVDVYIKGVLYGIAAALPVFRAQGFGHFIHTASTAAHRIVANMAVYAATKMAVRAISEGLRQEAGERLRVTLASPGFTRTAFAESMTDPALQAQTQAAMDRMALSPDAIARAMAYAIEQPDDVDVGEIVVRPTAQA